MILDSLQMHWPSLELAASLAVQPAVRQSG
jgi:hypothetical protein